MKIRYIVGLLLAAFLITACTVPEVVQVKQPDGTVTLVTNQVVEPKVTTTIETLKVVNAGTAPVNPYAPIIAVVLGFATIASTTWGSVATMLKNKKEKQLQVVVQGVEQAGTAADPVKLAIASHSANAGIKLELDSAVQKIVAGG
jgi:hypothetical protein